MDTDLCNAECGARNHGRRFDISKSNPSASESNPLPTGERPKAGLEADTPSRGEFCRPNTHCTALALTRVSYTEDGGLLKKNQRGMSEFFEGNHRSCECGTRNAE